MQPECILMHNIEKCKPKCILMHWKEQTGVYFDALRRPNQSAFWCIQKCKLKCIWCIEKGKPKCFLMHWEVQPKPILVHWEVQTWVYFDALRSASPSAFWWTEAKPECFLMHWEGQTGVLFDALISASPSAFWCFEKAKPECFWCIEKCKVECIFMSWKCNDKAKPEFILMHSEVKTEVHFDVLRGQTRRLIDALRNTNLSVFWCIEKYKPECILM